MVGKLGFFLFFVVVLELVGLFKLDNELLLDLKLGFLLLVLFMVFFIFINKWFLIIGLIFMIFF